MNFEHQFTLNLPIADAWKVLNDLPLIAPCMPGAKLDEVEGDAYKGSIKVRVGPITSQYRGVATIIERDAVNHSLVLDAKGVDTAGQGGATAHVVGKLSDLGSSRTQVALSTELQISGKVAQLGQGMIKDVSSRLLQQFVTNLEVKLAEDAPAARVAADTLDAEAPIAAASEGRRIDSPEATPIDVGALGASVVLQRYGMAIAFAMVIVLELIIMARQ